MQKPMLGKNRLEVSTLGFGCMGIAFGRALTEHSA